MPNFEIIESNTTTILCDGGDNFGHPAIYLNIGLRDVAVCPYCSRRFKYCPEKRFSEEKVT
jgi:uncharacterized Zn-finger protein